jgi:hypothetical protein
MKYVKIGIVVFLIFILWKCNSAMDDMKIEQGQTGPKVEAATKELTELLGEQPFIGWSKSDGKYIQVTVSYMQPSKVVLPLVDIQNHTREVITKHFGNDVSFISFSVMVNEPHNKPIKQD